MFQLPRPTARSGRAALVLAGALLLTGLATEMSRRGVESRREALVADAIEEGMARLESRVTAYLALLRATRAFVVAEGEDLNAARFREFVDGLRLARDYPGLQGIGWSPLVERAGWRFHVLYLEPLDARNIQALGFDMHSEPVRAAAMDRARDEGASAMSGMVTLKQEITTDKSPGFLIYAPLYEGDEVPPTVQARRERLAGFVYAPFRSVNFISGLFQAPGAALRSIHSAGTTPQGDLLWGQEAPPGLELVTRHASVAGQAWTLRFEPQARLSLGERLEPLFVLAAGLAISLLLYQLTRALGRQRRQAEERNQVLQQQVQFAELFVGIVSHDLRNPLNVIRLNAAMLAQAPLAAQQSQQVRRIEASAVASERMIHDLLDLTRARLAGGIPVQRQPGDLAAILHQALESMKSAHPQRAFRLEAEGDGRGLWDADRLAQAAGNLLGNAVAHGDPQAPITVRMADHGHWLDVSVHNEGEPIPPHLLGVLFEPMRQGLAGAGAQERSIGLGLFIVEQIAKAHGGTVACRSSPGEGTIFTLSLPRDQVPGRGGTPPEERTA